MLKIITASAAIAIAMGLQCSPASADTITTRCQAVRVGNSFERACATTIEHAAPAPAPVVDSAPVTRGEGTTELVHFDPIEAARVLAIPKHDPDSINLCPAPRHMTARDGCQR